MGLYELLREYAVEINVQQEPSSATPELGYSLSLFHTGLLESGLPADGPDDNPLLTASPQEIDGVCLSYFVVAFLPFSSISRDNEMNTILFDVYSFFKWMDKSEIEHGLGKRNLMGMIKELCSMQARCLKLSHLLDDESGRVLESNPDVVKTVNDVFTVMKIEKNMLTLEGQNDNESFRLRLPAEIIPLVELQDYLELVLGDTTESWVLIEAGQVFPDFPMDDLTNGNSPSN
ncbi:hypothetical protein MNBD_NITROSPINAE05-1009 [hydrothermal vent metagenome]|uniref:Uncharacterized protein n=1 Tax=hydrothermal vent metagenome TaxID=652676 RepID=A0A3B1CWP3_9ZZZZ